MSLKTIMIVAAAFGGFVYAGSACCPAGAAAKPEAPAPEAAVRASIAVVAAVPQAAEAKATEAVTVAAKAACETACAADKACDAEKACDAAKPACNAVKTAEDGSAKACAEGCGCKA